MCEAGLDFTRHKKEGIDPGLSQGWKDGRLGLAGVARGGLFGLVWFEIDGAGLDWFDFIYQGYRFVQKVTYGSILPPMIKATFK